MQTEHAVEIDLRQAGPADAPTPDVIVEWLRGSGGNLLEREIKIEAARIIEQAMAAAA